MSATDEEIANAFQKWANWAEPTSWRHFEAVSAFEAGWRACEVCNQEQETR